MAEPANVQRISRPGAPPQRPVTYVHIGAPKTGTTFLQTSLWNNRDSLRDHGVLYPGSRRLSHTDAALDLQNQRFFGHEDPNIPGAWARLVDEIRAWRGTAIISQELLSPAEPEHIDRAMADLDFSDVHLVYTARDLVRQIPAAWQEDLKNRSTLSFVDFLDCLRSPVDEMHPLAAGFWRMQDAVDILGRWARHVPDEHVHLITIARENAPNSLLWHRFCRAIGIDPDRFAPAEDAANISLGINEANLLRRLNLCLGERLRWPLYNDCVTGLIAIDVLAARKDKVMIKLPDIHRPWVIERSHEMVEALRGRNYQIVGDLDELLPVAAYGSATSPHPDKSDEAAMLNAAIESMTALLDRLQQWRDEIDHVRMLHAELREDRDILQTEVERLNDELAGARNILAKPATKLFVRRLSEKSRIVMRARIIYWNVMESLRRLRTGAARTTTRRRD